jgi:hypothetical protein
MSDVSAAPPQFAYAVAREVIDVRVRLAEATQAWTADTDDRIVLMQ